MRRAFVTFDRNRSGTLSVNELRAALRDCGLELDNHAAARRISFYDDKPDGVLDVHEFAQLVVDLSAGMPRTSAPAAAPTAAEQATAAEAAAAEATAAAAGAAAPPSSPSRAAALSAATYSPSAFHVPSSPASGQAPNSPGASSPARGGPAGRAPLQSIGWVTVHKGGRELVTPRGTLHAGERQRAQTMWARRIAVDRRFGGAEHTASMLKTLGTGAPSGKLSAAVRRSTDASQSGFAPQNKKTKSSADVASRQSVYANELASDPKRIGFAFGGVDPGRLHAHGQIIEVHKVHYSIAMCGTYRLHVALRHDAVELPGSPFLLKVAAGPASALSTAIPAESLPLVGVVGSGDDAGCRVLLKALDKMGNPCESGGASVACHCGHSEAEQKVESRVVDHKDGTYLLEWRSRVAGVFDAHVLVDGLSIIGSPTLLRLESDKPDLKQSELKGEGLSKAIAGKGSRFRIKCKDRFGNPAQSSTDLTFEMAMLPPVENVDKKDRTEKQIISDRWKTAIAHPIKGAWHDEEYEVRYVAEVAGNLELHVWCLNKEPSAKGGKSSSGGRSTSPVAGGRNSAAERGSGADKEGGASGGGGGWTREALPGSPFLMHCAAGRAHAQGSSVDGFSRIDPEAQTNRAGGGRGTAASLKPQAAVQKRSKARETLGSYEDSIDIYAGEAIAVRPKIRDKLGNNTAAPEGALFVTVHGPDDEEVELKPNVAIRSGLTNYDVRFEPQLAGCYEMSVLLAGAPIAGSPVKFECIANLPEISKCLYVLPTDPDCPTTSLFSQRKYSIFVTCKDRCGNKLDHGGAVVTGRLQSANLPPQQDAVLEVEDKDDGTYEIFILLKAAAELKVIVSIDKDRQGDGGGEFAPIPLSFISEEALKARQAKEAQKLWQQAVASGQAQGTLAAGAGAASGGVPGDNATADASATGAAKPAHTAEEIVEMAVEEFVAKGAERSSRRPGASGSPARAATGGRASVGGATSSSSSGEGLGSPKAVPSLGSPTPKGTPTKAAASPSRKMAWGGAAAGGGASNSGSSPARQRPVRMVTNSFGSAGSSGGAFSSIGSS